MAGNLLTQSKALSSKLTVNQKLSLGALSAVVIFGALFFTYLIRSEPYQLLFSDLDATSASRIQDRLDQLEIPYELNGVGDKISVPSDRAAEARIEVVSEGLLTTGRVGFEIFDKNHFGVTDFIEKVNYRRALEGELEKSIIAMNEVNQARVHLVLAKERLYEDEDQPAKASVVIKTRYGATLNRNRTRGIQNVVAYAVEDLKPENVTVVDMDSNLLSERTSTEEGLTDAQLDHRQKEERDLSRKVVSILEPIVGDDNVRVTTSVQIDFSETEQTETQYDPNQSVILSHQRSAELVGKSAETQGGVPFQANDLTSQPEDQGPKNTRDMQTEMTNYKVGETIRQTRMPGGSVLSRSVAVVVNDRLVLMTDENGEQIEELQTRSTEEMDQLRNLVSATIGFNAGRGDVLTVENISFSPAPLRTAEPVIETSFLEKYKNEIYPVARYLLVFVMFGLFYLVIFRPVKNKVFSYVDVNETQFDQLAAAVKDPELLKQLENHLKNPDGAPALPEAQKQTLDPKADANKQLVSMAKDDPQIITQVIKNWLSEGAQ